MYPHVHPSVERVCLLGRAQVPLPLITASAEELTALPLKEIKKILTERNISTADVYEKVTFPFPARSAPAVAAECRGEGARWLLRVASSAWPDEGAASTGGVRATHFGQGELDHLLCRCASQLRLHRTRRRAHAAAAAA